MRHVRLPYARRAPWLDRPRVALLTACLAVLTTAPAGAAAEPPPLTVVAVVGEDGVEVLHEQFRTRDGRDAVLPDAVARTAVRVTLPPASLDYDERVERLMAGPLGRLAPDTTYYVRGTRLLLRTGPASTGGLGQVAGPETFHGTGVTSLAGGRTTGTDPDALLVIALLDGESTWDWVADQPWVDVATSSGFDVLGGSAPVLCTAARAVARLRDTGRLAYFIAGNGFIETLAFSPGHSGAVVRVGGVAPDGTPYVADDFSNYTAHGYDLAELWRNPIAAAGTQDELTAAGGTSGATPRVAGRATALLRHARTLLRDSGSGARDGALAVAAAGVRLPVRGPLADGRLTGEELLRLQLLTSRPSQTAEGGRYAYEGFGWNDDRAAATARAVLQGRADLPVRDADEAAYAAALQARQAVTTAKGCTLPAPFD